LAHDLPVDAIRIELAQRQADNIQRAGRTL